MNKDKGLSTTALVRYIRRLDEYQEWKRSVFIRDRFTCQVCGKRNGRKIIIEAHHIRELSTLVKTHAITSVDEAIACPALWQISNGQTLCRTCHEQTDSFPKNFVKPVKKKYKQWD
ncbi:HNH endonuclease [Spirosoma agri]|uniref:HNH endonuclease n=1 Tax=Spirosoma agri TaxID=1987381 RepID=A0A6M0IJI8_9BACT|nr:HNH endonuclease signature motif containing protein [Spirosoma agri]NEU67785.1 HNH endonuclease [Spirosoma agri]